MVELREDENATLSDRLAVIDAAVRDPDELLGWQVRGSTYPPSHPSSSLLFPPPSPLEIYLYTSIYSVSSTSSSYSSS